jgi:hypothetical protein
MMIRMTCTDHRDTHSTCTYWYAINNDDGR